MSIGQNQNIIRSAPYFPVTDIEKTGEYYSEVLGFGLEYSGGMPPQFAIHSRDGLAIMLKLVSGSNNIIPNEAQGGTWDAFFWVNDVHALYEELLSKGATVAYGVVYQESYNMDEFAVRDLNGYVLGFGQPRTTKPSAEAN